jgi:uncharacterized protein (TIGR02217 family)
MAFVEERFPDDISWGSIGGPRFRTTIIESGGGHEQRNIDWSQARGKWSVVHGAKTREQMDNLIAWFYAMHGRAHGFRFKDHTDFTAENEWFGDGDGAEDEFQLVKTYDIIGQAYVRTIAKPVVGTVHVFLDGVEQVEVTDWSLDYTTGLVTMVVPPLATPEVLTWTGDFDVPVRFDSDEMAVSDDFQDIETWGLTVLEIRV